MQLVLPTSWGIVIDKMWFCIIYKLGLVAQAYNPVTWMAEAGRYDVQGHGGGGIYRVRAYRMYLSDGVLALSV